MLRLATKLVAFFWRKADGPEEEARPPGLEPREGARGAVPACSGVGAGTGGRRAAAQERSPLHPCPSESCSQAPISNLPKRSAPRPLIGSASIWPSVQCGLEEAARARVPLPEGGGAGPNLRASGVACAGKQRSGCSSVLGPGWRGSLSRQGIPRSQAGLLPEPGTTRVASFSDTEPPDAATAALMMTKENSSNSPQRRQRHGQFALHPDLHQPVRFLHCSRFCPLDSSLGPFHRWSRHSVARDPARVCALRWKELESELRAARLTHLIPQECPPAPWRPILRAGSRM